MSRWPILLFSWLLVAPGAARADDITHVARTGDTPVALSKIYHVSVAAILSHNKGLDPCHIKVGDVILVPVPIEAPSPPPAASPAARNAVLPDEETSDVRYVVVSGDYPAAIAERFGVPLDVLSRANPGLDAKNLTLGRVRPTPKGQGCPPPVPVDRPGQPASGASAPLVMDFL